MPGSRNRASPSRVRHRGRAETCYRPRIIVMGSIEKSCWVLASLAFLASCSSSDEPPPTPSSSTSVGAGGKGGGGGSNTTGGGGNGNGGGGAGGATTEGG